MVVEMSTLLINLKEDVASLTVELSNWPQIKLMEIRVSSSFVRINKKEQMIQCIMYSTKKVARSDACLIDLNDVEDQKSQLRGLKQRVR